MSRGSKVSMPYSPEITRPQLPKDYGLLAEDAGSGLLPWSRVSQRLAVSRNYWVHTVRPHGRPHVKPVWGLWFQERFYFSTNPRSIAAKNLSANPRLAVHLESGDAVVILEGRAEPVTDHALLSRLDEAYFTKFSYHLVSEGSGVVYTLHHKVAFAWLEREFTGSATRYTFKN